MCIIQDEDKQPNSKPGQGLEQTFSTEDPEEPTHEKVLNVISHEGNANQGDNEKKYCLITMKTATIRGTNVGADVGKSEPSHPGAAPGEDSSAVPQKAKPTDI